MRKVSLPLRLQLALAIIVASSASVGVFVLAVWNASATESRYEFDQMLNRRSMSGKMVTTIELERKEGMYQRVLHAVEDEGARWLDGSEDPRLIGLLDLIDRERLLDVITLRRADGRVFVLRRDRAEGAGPGAEMVDGGEAPQKSTTGWRLLLPEDDAQSDQGAWIVRREVVELGGERMVVSAATQFVVEPEMLAKLGSGSITTVVDGQGAVVWQAGTAVRGLATSGKWSERPSTEMSDSFEHEGKQWHARVSVVPWHGWRSIAFSETDTALAATNGAKQLMALSAVMVMGSGLVGMLLATRLIQKPLTKLTQAALAISKGDWSRPLPEGGPTEIRQLSLAFGSMLEQLRRTYMDIERRVMDRTEELTQSHQALEEARAKAEAAAGAKEQFLANVSHEIRTPMTALLGYMEVLCDDNSGEREVAAARQTMRRSGEHIMGLINDILDITKLEGDQVRATVTAVSPLELVRQIWEQYRSQVESKGLRFVMDAGAVLPATIESDPIIMQQMLGRLLHNAIKFTSEGEIGLQVELSDEEPAELRIVVRDTGLGIEPSQLERLFEPFAQADESMTRNHGGLGVGLAIAQRLSRVLGGRIEVASKVGKGTRFTVVIPLGERGLLTLIDGKAALANLELEPATRAEAGGAGDAKAEGTPPQERGDGGAVKLSLAGSPSSELPLSGARILMVDDCPDNRRLISLFCRKAGAEISLCNDGQAGFEAAMDAHNLGIPFDMILMDMQMPVMDGYEATMRLRAKGYRLPIVAFTAHAMAGDRERCLGVGCSDYLTKPVTAKALLERCVKWVAKGRELQQELAKKRAA